MTSLPVFKMGGRVLNVYFGKQRRIISVQNTQRSELARHSNLEGEIINVQGPLHTLFNLAYLPLHCNSISFFLYTT